MLSNLSPLYHSSPYIKSFSIVQIPSIILWKNCAIGSVFCVRNVGFLTALSCCWTCLVCIVDRRHQFAKKVHQHNLQRTDRFLFAPSHLFNFSSAVYIFHFLDQIHPPVTICLANNQKGERRAAFWKTGWMSPSAQFGEIWFPFKSNLKIETKRRDKFEKTRPRSNLDVFLACVLLNTVCLSACPPSLKGLFYFLCTLGRGTSHKKHMNWSGINHIMQYLIHT